MRTVGIRDLRGSTLRESSSKGELLAIANHRVLIGIFVPATSAWVEQVIDYNLSQVYQSIAEGEQAMTAGVPMATLDGVLAAASDVGYEGQGPGPRGPAGLTAQLSAAAVGESVVLSSASKEAIAGLKGALGFPQPAGGRANQDEPSVHPIRVGDLSAAQIEKAGVNGRVLAITYDRELVGIVIPVTPDLVQFLMEQNISRVLYNVGLGEKEIGTGEKLATLDGTLREAESGRASTERAGQPTPGAPVPGRRRARLRVLLSRPAEIAVHEPAAGRQVNA
jgi:hypothetical protein